MKKALLYLLLFAYATIICKPVIPILSDCVAHVFWYSEHMATVHYEHGKYHVHYENVNEAKKDSPAKDANLPKSAAITGEHLLASTSYHFAVTAIVPVHFSVFHTFFPPTGLHSDFPPPKA